MHRLSGFLAALLPIFHMPADAQGSPSVATSQNVSRKGAAALLGRLQGPELFFQQPFATLTQPIIPRNINLTRPLESLKIIWRGRIVIGTANISPIACEAPQTIIQRIRLTGTHRLFNQLVPIDITGATAFAWMRIFQQRGASLIINATRSPELTVPIAAVGATFGNTGTYDIEIHYDIPLGPMLGPHSRLSLVPYYYFPQDWADTLQLQLFFGDGTSFGTLGTSTVTFTAFGSGSGVPLVTIEGNYALLGPMASSFRGGVVIRNEAFIVGGPVAAVATAQRLTLLQKQKTLNVVVKSGILLTGTSAGVQVFTTLNDTMLERTQIVLDNKPVRNNATNFAAKEYCGRQFNTIVPGGYFPFTFLDSMSPQTMYRGDQVPGGSTFELDSDVTAAAANQAITVIQEQVYGNPGVKSAPA